MAVRRWFPSALAADFYPHCSTQPDLVGALQDAQVTVGPMTADEIRRVIVQPAARARCTVESALVAHLVAQAHGRPGVLPLLSHALLETWRRRQGNALTLAGFHATGGIERALARTAESVFTTFDTRQQRVAKQRFRRLTAPGEATEATKRRIATIELSGRSTAAPPSRITALERRSKASPTSRTVVSPRRMTTARSGCGPAEPAGRSSRCGRWRRTLVWTTTPDERAGFLTFIDDADKKQRSR
ncbi:hypothetical protein ACFWY5_17910 [Nonomuraea sp. NPDC059007]|uniref:nSTAND1 domain-containing NTPase n=1 Tax=Nonomuraea sp. NPDC059007 TaxID=3346692 RepID=UPI0036B83BFA